MSFDINIEDVRKIAAHSASPSSTITCGPPPERSAPTRMVNTQVRFPFPGEIDKQMNVPHAARMAAGLVQRKHWVVASQEMFRSRDPNRRSRRPLSSQLSATTSPPTSRLFNYSDFSPQITLHIRTLALHYESSIHSIHLTSLFLYVRAHSMSLNTCREHPIVFQPSRT